MLICRRVISLKDLALSYRACRHRWLTQSQLTTTSEGCSIRLDTEADRKTAGSLSPSWLLTPGLWFKCQLRTTGWYRGQLWLGTRCLSIWFIGEAQSHITTGSDTSETVGPGCWYRLKKQHLGHIVPKLFSLSPLPGLTVAFRPEATAVACCTLLCTECV